MRFFSSFVEERTDPVVVVAVVPVVDGRDGEGGGAVLAVTMLRMFCVSVLSTRKSVSCHHRWTVRGSNDGVYFSCSNTLEVSLCA